MRFRLVKRWSIAILGCVVLLGASACWPFSPGRVAPPQSPIPSPVTNPAAASASPPNPDVPKRADVKLSGVLSGDISQIKVTECGVTATPAEGEPTWKVRGAGTISGYSYTVNLSVTNYHGPDTYVVGGAGSPLQGSVSVSKLFLSGQAALVSGSVAVGADGQSLAMNRLVFKGNGVNENIDGTASCVDPAG